MDISLNHKLAQIQTELKVHKSQLNKFGNYKYRSAEDFTEALKPFLLPHDVTVTLKEKYLGNNVIKSTAIISDGIQKIKATAIVGVDTDQKGMQMPQRFGSASSYGKKYSLGNLFLIDDTQDSDAINKHEKTQKPILLKNTPNYKKVEYAMSNGFTIDDVKKKYTLNDELILELEQINK
jgi:hypothetical protein